MKWYFVAGDKTSIDMLLEEGVKSILVSYAYFKRGLPENLLAAQKKGKVRILLDSGAYTNLSKPGTVTLEGYLDYLKSHKAALAEYIVLDDPKKREITLRNYALMLKNGLDPLIVDHVWFDWDHGISKVYSSGRKICWGGLISKPDGPMGDWASKMPASSQKRVGYSQTARAWLGICRRLVERHKKANHGKKTTVHLLAVGARLPRLLPFFDVIDSFDATTWALGSGMGVVFDCEAKQGEVPRIRRYHETRVPPEVKAKNKGLDYTSWHGRRVIAIRALKEFYSKLEAFYEQEKKKGFEHLWRMTLGREEDKQKDEGVKKSVFVLPADPSVFASRELWDAGIIDEQLVKSVDSRSKLAGEIEELLEDDSPVDESEKSITEDVKLPEWQTLREKLVGTWVGNERQNVRLLRDFLGGVRSATSRKLRIVENYLRGTAFRSGRIKHAAIDELREQVQEELATRAEKNDVRLLPVEKADEDRHVVFGVVLEPDEVDAQGDTISPDEIERAAHLWLARFQDRGLQHEKIVNSKVEIYESYLAPSNLTMGGQKVKKGTWLLMLHVLDDALWTDIKQGKFTGFSMGGFARRVRT